MGADTEVGNGAGVDNVVAVAAVVAVVPLANEVVLGGAGVWAFNWAGALRG